MAARLNTRFILILSVVAVVLVGGGIAGYMVVNKTGEDWARAARQAEEAGDWETAVRYWERAVGHEHANYEWLSGWRDAYGHIVPENKQTALETYLKLQSIYGAIATARPDDAAAQKASFEFRLDSYRRMGVDTQTWITFAESVTDSLEYIGDPLESGYEPGSEEELEYCSLLRYRALAQVEQMRRVELAQAQRQQIRDDLQRCLQADPSDVTVATALAEWHLIEAQRLLTQRRLAEYKEAWQASTTVLEEFVEQNPNDPQALANLAIRVQQQLRQQLAEAQSPDQRLALQQEARQRSLDYLERAEAALQEKPDQMAILSMSVPNGLLVMMDPENGVERALALVERGLQEDKNDTMLLFRKAELLRNAGRFDEAMAALQRVADLPTPTAGLGAYILFIQRPHAVFQQFNTMMEQWRRTPDEAERAQALARAQEIRQEYLNYTTSAEEDPNMWLIDGQLAHASGNTAEAIRLLQKVRSSTAGFDSHLKYVLADALQQRGQLGDAEAVLSEAFAEMAPVDPLWPAVFSTLINLEQQLGMGASACDTIEKVLPYYPPDSDIAQQLMNVHQRLARDYELTDRLGLFGQNVQVDPRQQLMDEIRKVADDEGSFDTLRQMVQRLVQQYPDDPQALEIRARLYDSQGGEYTEQALAAWRDVLRVSPEHVLAKARLEILQGADPVDIAIQQIDENPDLSQVQKALGHWKVYTDAGRPQLAAAALERARALDPTHADVVEISFITALNEQKWDKAWELVNLSREKNLDQANGDLFEARLHHAQGDLQTAITQLTRIIERNPLQIEAYWLRARSYYDSGNLAGCITDLQRAYTSRPNDLRIVNMLVQALRQRGDDIKALEIVRSAHKRNPTDASIIGLWRALEESVGDTAAVTEDYRKRYANNRNDLQLASGYAHHLIELDDFAAADEVLKNIEAQAPDDIRTLNLRANWHASQGGSENIDAGQAVYVDYIQSADPGALTSAPYMALADYLVRNGREGDAVTWLAEALPKQDPASLGVQRRLADVYFEAGRFEQAASQYREVFNNATDLTGDEREYVVLRLIEATIGMGQTEQAYARLQQHMGTVEPRLEHYLLESRIHELNNDTPKARQALDKAVATDPNSPYGYFKRAVFNHEDPAMRSDVLADLARAMEIMPSFRQARELLILVLYEDGKLEQALNEQGKLVELNPKDKDLRRKYADNLKTANRDEEQLQVLVQGSQIFPEEPNWHAEISRWKLSHEDITGAQDSMLKAYEISERDPRFGLLYADVLLRDGARKDPELALHILNRHEEPLRGYFDLYLLRARAMHELGRTNEVQREMSRAWEVVKRSDASRSEAGERWANTLKELFEPLNLDGMLAVVQGVMGEDVPPVIYLVIAQYTGDYSARVPGMDQRLIGLLETILDSPDVPARAEVTAAMFMASLNYRQQNQEEAVRLYQIVLREMLPNLETVENDPFPVARLQCLNNLAYILAEVLDRPEEALPFAEEGVLLRPQDADVQDTLGFVYLKLGRLNDAQATLSKSLTIKETMPALLHMTEVQIELGKFGEADAYLRKAEQKVAPNETDNLEEIERLRQKLQEAQSGGG